MNLEFYYRAILMLLYLFAILDMITHVSPPTKVLKTVKFALQSPIIDHFADC